MKTIKITASYTEKASRWELLWRIFWQALCGIVLVILLIPTVVASLLQLAHILIFGKRHFRLNRLTANWITYLAQISFYKNFCTDERPPLIPEYW